MTDDVRTALIFVVWYLGLLLVAFSIVDGVVRGDLFTSTWAATTGDDLHNILFGGPLT
jgi:hypothetical protein